MAKVQNGVETLPKITTAWVRCTSVTNRWKMGDSEREREFMLQRNLRVRSLMTHESRPFLIPIAPKILGLIVSHSVFDGSCATHSSYCCWWNCLLACCCLVATRCVLSSLSSSRQLLSNDDCLEDNGEDCQNCSVLYYSAITALLTCVLSQPLGPNLTLVYCVLQYCSDMHAHTSSSYGWFGLLLCVFAILFLCCLLLSR